MRDEVFGNGRITDDLHQLVGAIQIVVPLPHQTDSFADKIVAGLNGQIIATFADERDFATAAHHVDAESLGNDVARGLEAGIDAPQIGVCHYFGADLGIMW